MANRRLLVYPVPILRQQKLKKDAKYSNMHNLTNVIRQVY